MPEQITGRTHFAGLFELIQICAMHGRSVALTFTEKDRTATIAIQDGVLCDAMSNGLRADEAVYDIFGWVDSHFALAPLSEQVERTVVSSNTDILMAALEKTKDIKPPSFGPVDRIAGSLEVMSLTELLQLFEINCHSAVLKLRNIGDVGHIHLRGGRVVHATVGTGEGDRAVLDLLSWPAGDFMVQHDQEHVVETVLDSISGLLLQGSIRTDMLDRIAGDEQKT